MKPGIAKVVTFAMLLAAGATSAEAQNDGNHSLVEGAWALQFGIAENLTLGHFTGGVISAKHQRAADRALRYGLTLSTVHTSGRAAEPDRTDATVGFVAHFLRYPTLSRDPAGTVHMFWGLGPLVRFQASRISNDAGDDTSRVVSAGAGGVVGGEWFVRPRISLSAEYQTALVATFLSSPAPVEWGVGLGQEGVRFGVSMYFR